MPQYKKCDTCGANLDTGETCDCEKSGTEIMSVTRIPEITERLHEIKSDIELRIEKASSLDVTEETVRKVKKERTALNEEFKGWEAKRKQIKDIVLAPYEEFNATYKTCVTDVFVSAIEGLDKKIKEVENGLKDEVRNEILTYFTELCSATGIDFVSFDRIIPKVNLSDTPTKLKKSVKAFIDAVTNDLAMIDTQDHSVEILVEYKKSLNASQSIMMVNNRVKAIEEERLRAEEEKIRREQQKAAAEKVEAAIQESKVSNVLALSAPMVTAIHEPPTGTVETNRHCLSFIATHPDGTVIKGNVDGDADGIRHMRKILTEGGFAVARGE